MVTRREEAARCSLLPFATGRCSILAPCAWDLARLATSALIAAKVRALAISDGDRKRVKGFMREFGKECGNPRFFKALDVARRIAGTGSLGLERYTILVAGRGTPAGRFLLDLKAARPSALAPYVKQQQPRWSSEAERIVAIERRMQAVASALIHPVSIDSTSYVLRELMPTEDKLDLKGWKGSREGLDLLARDLGYLVA